MKCAVWTQIQDELDSDLGFSPSVRDHLVTCPRCARDLAVYRRLIKSYTKEAVFPSAQRNPVYAFSPRLFRRRPLLLAVAAVLAVLVAAGGLLAVPHFQDAALRRDFFRDFSESIIDGGAFEYAGVSDPGYDSSWF